jgi:hypothetical protein
VTHFQSNKDIEMFKNSKYALNAKKIIRFMVPLMPCGKFPNGKRKYIDKFFKQYFHLEIFQMEIFSSQGPGSNLDVITFLLILFCNNV